MECRGSQQILARWWGGVKTDHLGRPPGASVAPAGGDWSVGPAEPWPQVNPAHQARLRQGNFLMKDENRGPSMGWRTGMKRDNKVFPRSRSCRSQVINTLV